MWIISLKKKLAVYRPNDLLRAISVIMQLCKTCLQNTKLSCVTDVTCYNFGTRFWEVRAHFSQYFVVFFCCRFWIRSETIHLNHKRYTMYVFQQKFQHMYISWYIFMTRYTGLHCSVAEAWTLRYTCSGVNKLKRIERYHWFPAQTKLTTR